MISKIGYNVHNKMTYRRDWSADEEAYHFAHIARLQPGAMLYMDDTGRALRCKALLPDCVVVVRSYRGEGDEGKLHETLTPQQCFELYKDTPKGLIRQIMNEPGGYGDTRALAHWLAQVCDLFGNVGIPIAVPNFGEGHPDVDHLDYLDELWAALDKWHDLHYYTTHEYGTWRGMIFNSGGSYDVYPWRVGRFETFTLPYLQKNGHKIPRVIITEFGCDSAHDGTEKRGWKTAWSEAQYFSESIKSIEKVYHAPHYVGVCYFSWGNTGQQFTESDWSTFDMSEAKVFHSLAEDYAAKDAPSMPLPSMPKPSNANDKHRMKATQDVELLTGAAAGYALKGVIHTGFEVDLYNMPATSDRGVYFKWADVRTGPLVGMGGWVRDDVNWQEVKKATSEVPPVVVVPPPPPPVVVVPPPPPPVVVETPVRYRMQIITFKEVSLPPSIAKTLIEAGVSLEMIV